MITASGDGPAPMRGKHLPSSRGLGSRFRTLYSGTAVSLLGNYVAYLTIPLLVAEVVGGTEETLPFSISYALETLPTLVFGLVGGVILDRIRLRWAMIVADLGVSVPQAGLLISGFAVGLFDDGEPQEFLGSPVTEFLPEDSTFDPGVAEKLAE